MLPSIATPFNLTGTLLSCTNSISACLTSEKIRTVALDALKVCTSTYLCLFGTYELSQNIVKKEIPEKDLLLNKVMNASKAYLYVHGGMILSSDLFGLIEVLQKFGFFELISINQAMTTAANVLFLGANLVAFRENVRLLHELSDADWSQTNIDKQELHLMKQSAFFGFVSNLGYMITAASILFNAATAFTIIAAIFSCFCGGIKFLYDLSLWAKEQGLFKG